VAEPIPVRASDLLPELAGTRLADAPLTELTPVGLPVVVGARAGAKRLTADERRELLLSPQQWRGKANLQRGDLPWLLAKWLPVGRLGIPIDAHGCAHSAALALAGGAVGFALKAVGPDDAFDWSVIRDELGKAPTVPAGRTYVLVVWSLNLAPEVQAALGDEPCHRYEAGRWYYRSSAADGGRLTQEAPGHDNPAFEVPANVELVVTNPHATGGGTLADLLGKQVLRDVRIVVSLPQGPSSLGDPANVALWNAGEASPYRHRY